MENQEIIRVKIHSVEEEKISSLEEKITDLELEIIELKARLDIRQRAYDDLREYIRRM